MFVQALRLPSLRDSVTSFSVSRHSRLPASTLGGPAPWRANLMRPFGTLGVPTACNLQSVARVGRLMLCCIGGITKRSRADVVGCASSLQCGEACKNSRDSSRRSAGAQNDKFTLINRMRAQPRTAVPHERCLIHQIAESLVSLARSPHQAKSGLAVAPGPLGMWLLMKPTRIWAVTIS
jgi:hypothetical protein